MNVSSVAAIMPMGSPTMTSYGVAKAAQDTLTKNLAFEFATKGVRVNSVLPGEPALATHSHGCPGFTDIPLVRSPLVQ